MARTRSKDRIVENHFGSASIDLLRQSGESLAGRLARVELNGLTVA